MSAGQWFPFVVGADSALGQGPIVVAAFVTRFAAAEYCDRLNNDSRSGIRYRVIQVAA